MEDRDGVVVAVGHVDRVRPDGDGVRVAAAVGGDALLDLSDLEARLDDRLHRGVLWGGHVQHVDRGALGDIGITETGNPVLAVGGNVPAPDPLRVAQREREVPRVDLLDGDEAIMQCFVGVAGAGVAEGVIEVLVTGRISWSQVRVLEDADVAHEQGAVIRGERDAIGIPTDLHPGDDGREVVRLVDETTRGGSDGDLRGIDHVHQEACLVDDVQEATVAGQRHVAGEGALEPAGRRVDGAQRPVERMAGTVQVHGADDHALSDITDPDVAVVTARRVEELAVGGEDHAHERRVDRHLADCGVGAVSVADQRHREAGGAAVDRRQCLVVG